jgi:hypothetical protein
MTDTHFAVIVLVSTFAASLIGLLVRRYMPSHHLAADTKDAVKLAIGLVTTMTALLLGLLINSTKSAYELQRAEVTQLASKIVVLDRTLARYGAEAQPARTLLHQSVREAISRMWPDTVDGEARLNPTSDAEAVYHSLALLAPTTEQQTTLKGQAMSLAFEISQVRWLMFEQHHSTISHLMLVTLALWLVIIFSSFGLYAPGNAASVLAFLVASIAVSTAVLLMLELDTPFEGILKIPDTPMRTVLQVAR